MKDEKNDITEKPGLVEEIGLLEGQKIIKSPPLLPSVERRNERGNDE